jgi:ribosomal protein S12 methylthiotransferase
MMHRTRDRAPRIHLASLGCAKNLVDSERLLGRLAMAGALVGADAEDADILIVNTCGFIAAAREESMRAISEYAALRRAGSAQALIVMGCLGERGAAQIRESVPEVDAVVGLHAHEEILRACGLAPTPDEDGRLLLTPPHMAYLRISDGCDNRCSYCTIPLIRGPLRSRSPEEILVEAEQLVRGGVRELVVIGQDTTSYGKDLPTAYPVHRLLRALSRETDAHWIRMLYAHPAYLQDELIEELASNPKLCAYVDLPLQHLDDDILERMGRRVSQAKCVRLIDRLRRRIPDVTIRTTFIVGFPGETDAQFETLLQGVRELRFDHLGAFAYSAEEGTPAASFEKPVPLKVVEERLDSLMSTQQSIVFEKNEGRIGERVEVLIDEPTEEKDVWVGRTQGQAPDVDSVTYVIGASLLPGQFVHAEIVGVEEYDLVAER